MTAKTAKPSTPRSTRKREGWYRGVKLQAPPTPPRTALSKLKDAVSYAVGRNADALSRGK